MNKFFTYLPLVAYAAALVYIVTLCATKGSMSAEAAAEMEFSSVPLLRGLLPFALIGLLPSLLLLAQGLLPAARRTYARCWRLLLRNVGEKRLQQERAQLLAAFTACLGMLAGACWLPLTFFAADDIYYPALGFGVSFSMSNDTFVFCFYSLLTLVAAAALGLIACWRRLNGKEVSMGATVLAPSVLLALFVLVCCDPYLFEARVDTGDEIFYEPLSLTDVGDFLVCCAAALAALVQPFIPKLRRVYERCWGFILKQLTFVTHQRAEKAQLLATATAWLGFCGGVSLLPLCYALHENTFHIYIPGPGHISIAFVFFLFIACPMMLASSVLTSLWLAWRWWKLGRGQA